MQNQIKRAAAVNPTIMKPIIMNLWFPKYLLYFVLCVEITESENRCPFSHCLSFHLFSPLHLPFSFAFFFGFETQSVAIDFSRQYFTHWNATTLRTFSFPLSLFQDLLFCYGRFSLCVQAKWKIGNVSLNGLRLSKSEHVIYYHHA